MNYPFVDVLDKFDTQYFTLPGIVGRNISQLNENPERDMGSFLNPFINITRLGTGPFQTDLTERDDVLLAFISLLLLLIIDSIVTTALLRTKHGIISNFGFSVNHIMALIREMNFRGIFPRRSAEKKTRRKLNVRLLLIACSILTITLGIEVAVLFLTDPTFQKVTNRTATFRLMHPVMPEWLSVRFHSRVSINRPCESFTLMKVEQAFTRINGCVETNLNFSEIDLFRVSDSTGQAELTIISDLHDYGSEHFISIDDGLNIDSANYSKRAYFTLDDGKMRLLKSYETFRNETNHMELVHVQLVAYVFSIYRNAVGKDDPNMNLARLKSLRFFFNEEQGGHVDVLQLPGKAEFVTTRRYVTKVAGVIPRGKAVLRVAQHHFRGTGAIVVHDPDDQDLFLESGINQAVAEVWKEDMRVVNWLSMAILIVICLLLLMILRCFFRPVATSEIASIYVKQAVGADMYRGPMELNSDEEEYYFRVKTDEEEYDYTLGAETSERRQRLRNNEYGNAEV